MNPATLWIFPLKSAALAATSRDFAATSSGASVRGAAKPSYQFPISAHRWSPVGRSVAE